MDLNQITYKIRGAIYAVHKELGPGLFESVYRKALLYELAEISLQAKEEVPVPAKYKNEFLDLGFRMDLLVEEIIIVEIKSIEILQSIHKKQLLTYLKLSGKKLGLLVNFNAVSIIDGESIFRIIN